MPNSKKISTKKTEIAISVKGVSKTFRIPHEKISSVKGAVLSAFKSKSYEEFQALDDVSFEVKKGEFFGIIGRNGSGKSTLLKVLAGIYQADKGKVEINGMISPFLELGIGFNPELSGRDNVYLNATVLGMTKKQIDEKFDSIVKFSELERFIDQKLKNYSSGMQVRLAFSVSIHANRDILLMDEVLAVGDSNFQSKCLTEFNKYRDMGRTVVIVTHDIAVVERYCDRAMLLRNGKIVKIGKAGNVVNEYIKGNISDEESRFYDADDNFLEKGLKRSELPKIAEIIKMEILDKNGKQKRVFETGEDISIRLYFNNSNEADVLNFGIGIHNVEGNVIFGVSTKFDNVDTAENMKKGFIEINFHEVKLRTNSYFIQAIIMDKTDSHIIDFLDRSRLFKIISKNRNDGIVELDYTWVS